MKLLDFERDFISVSMNRINNYLVYQRLLWKAGASNVPKGTYLIEETANE